MFFIAIALNIILYICAIMFFLSNELGTYSVILGIISLIIAIVLSIFIGLYYGRRSKRDCVPDCGAFDCIDVDKDGLECCGMDCN